MTSIPLAVFFIPYALFILVYFFFLFFNMYHLRTFGIKSFAAHVLGTIFLVGTVVILGASAVVLSRYDWSQGLNLEETTRPFTTTDVLNPFYDRSESSPQP